MEDWDDLKAFRRYIATIFLEYNFTKLNSNLIFNHA